MPIQRLLLFLTELSQVITSAQAEVLDSTAPGYNLLFVQCNLRVVFLILSFPTILPCGYLAQVFSYDRVYYIFMK